MESELARAKSGKFGVGFITWALANAPTMLTRALQHSPLCVFLSFGDPRPFAEEIRDAGVALICQVQFLSQIDMALEAGAAAIVVQGTEAGGHGGNRSTFPFVPEAADYLKQHSPGTLLIAAGGIADGRGLAAALMLGADAVVVGFGSMRDKWRYRAIASKSDKSARWIVIRFCSDWFTSPSQLECSRSLAMAGGWECQG